MKPLSGPGNGHLLIRALLVVVLPASSIAAPALVLAQEPSLSPGADVRLLVPPDREIRGQLVGWRGDTLRLESSGAGAIQAVPVREIVRLRLSEPRPRGRGALRGLAIGSIVGAVSLGVIAASDSCSGAYCFSAGTSLALGALVGGIGGGGIGAALGSLWPGTRWVEVPPERLLANEPGRSR